MKTYRKLFDKVIDFKNFVLAAQKAQRGKRMKQDVAGFNFGLEGELLRLQEELKGHTYTPGEYRHFYVHDPKRRLISAAPYRDRVVHHAFCNIVEPLFDKTFIYDSYACRIDKGTHRAMDRCQQFLRANRYVLQCDIAKYFPSINHQTLLSIIDRKIKDENIMWLTELIVKSTSKDAVNTEHRQPAHRHTGQPANRPTGNHAGIPIGNLTSQFFANLYLNELDYFVKFNLQERYYLRYMDDFLIFHNDKNRLQYIKERIREFLEKNLQLKLHSKKSIVFPIRLGVEFLGFRIFKHYSRLKKNNIRLFMKRMKKKQEQLKKGRIGIEDITRSLQCWIAHISYGNTYNLRKKLLKCYTFCIAKNVTLKVR